MDSHVHPEEVFMLHSVSKELSAGMHDHSAPVAGQPTLPVHTVAERCLTHLALLAVQPACLKAHPQATLQHHQQPPPAAVAAASAGGLPTSQQQDLLLHVEATFCMLQPETSLTSSSTPDAAASGSTAAYQDRHAICQAATDAPTAAPGVSAEAAMQQHARLCTSSSSPVKSTAHAFTATAHLPAKASTPLPAQAHAGVIAQHHATDSSSSTIDSATSSPMLETPPLAEAATAQAAAAAAAQLTAGGASSHEAMQDLQASANSAGVQLKTPVPLQHVQLELVVLSRQMQLLQRQRLQLLQLVEQQQQLQEQGQQEACPLQTGHAKQPSTAGASTGCSTSGSYNNSSSTVGNDGIHSSMLLNIPTSIPSLPSDRLLDCVHLVLMVGSGASQHPWEQHQSGKAAEPPSPGTVIANVPLLVLPAAAQQEVQQLLLPAMRQELQAEQLLGMTSPAAGDDLVSLMYLSLQVEHIAWQHYCQLAKDMYAVVQLSVAAEAEATSTAGVSTGTAHSSIPASAEAQIALVRNNTQLGLPAATAIEAASPAASLDLLAESLLFPLLLPFLAAQGMFNTMQQLLLCLPERLQQQWHQQQLMRLQDIARFATAPAQLPPTPEKQQPHKAAIGKHQNLQQQQQHGHCLGYGQAGGSQQTLPGQQQLPDSGSNIAASCDQANNTVKVDKAGPSSSKPRSGTEGTDVLAAQQKPQDHMLEAGVRNGGSSSDTVDFAPWYMPLTQFQDAHMEHSYLAWKQHSLLQLDYLSALFGLVYLAVLLRRMMSEPTTLFYFAVISTKVLPFVPLMLGRWQFYFRYRELLVSLVAPTMAIIACCLSLHSKLSGIPLVVLPDRAHSAYWKSRGELQTSVMRAFTHHMRLRPYIVATLIDACVSCWAFTRIGVSLVEAGSRYGVAAMVSVGTLWLFDWYMRHRYVRAQHQQQQLGAMGVGSGVCSKVQVGQLGVALVSWCLRTKSSTGARRQILGCKQC